MANADHLLLGIGVGAMLITIAVGAILSEPRPPEPGDPFEPVRFTTERSEYGVGDRVLFTLENGGQDNLIRLTWTVQRLLADEWIGVECRAETTNARALPAEETLRWSWIIGDEEAWCAYLLPPFDAGLYRGVAWLSMEDEPRGWVVLHAYFELVA